MMIVYGVDQVPKFNELSTVFLDIPSDRLCRIKYSILGITSSKGYEGKNLNIYRLALYNRQRYMLFKARKLHKYIKGSKVVRNLPDSNRKQWNIVESRINKYFRAS